jgi:2-polyprenyl-3-methyl-5-hydroxy-6-metoxy-1,4-benzoquinol methylase
MFRRPLQESRVTRQASHSSPYELKRFKYNSHYWILKFLPAGARLRILDVGTADGYLGALLKERGHSVVGIEENPAAAANARAHYDSFYLVDIEEFDFPYREEFDCILFADVLEHLANPAFVLRRSLPALKSTGEVIVSLPNIANIAIRLSLLAGRFDYGDRGILDRTHLRFFTLSSLRAMLREASCRIVEVAPTPLPIQLVLPMTQSEIFAPLHEFHYLLVRLWKTLFAYQFVVRAVPHGFNEDRLGQKPRGSGKLPGRSGETRR